jgi:hypothetical protein
MMNDQSKYFMNYSSGQFPDAFEKINTSLQINNSNPHTFNMTLTGEADYFNAHFLNKKTRTSMNIYATTNVQIFQIPDLGSIFQESTMQIGEFVLNNISVSKVNIPKSKYLNQYIIEDNIIDSWTKVITETYSF